MRKYIRDIVLPTTDVYNTVCVFSGTGTGRPRTQRAALLCHDGVE